MAPDQGRLEVGDGPGEPDTGDGDALGVADTEGVADTGGVAERDGVGERLGRGLRDGPGERAGLGADGVGLDTEVGLPADGAAAGIGTGRTRRYSANTPRNMTASGYQADGCEEGAGAARSAAMACLVHRRLAR